MALYALSDTHLSFAKDKPMDIFGEVWKNHPDKIRQSWLDTVTDEDTVLMPGDISWAINYGDLQPDMEFILSLTGKKIISQGNHDYWWNSTQRLNEMYSPVKFIKNDFFVYGDTAVCAIKGWTCPNDTYYTDRDEKLYIRETGRLQAVLDSAANKGYNKIAVMMHYPPTNDKKERSAFVELLEKYGVQKVIYGHLHGEQSFNASYKGIVNGIEYILVSGDYLNFMPKKIEL